MVSRSDLSSILGKLDQAPHARTLRVEIGDSHRILGRLGGLGGQAFDFARHHGEAFAGIANKVDGAGASFGDNETTA